MGFIFTAAITEEGKAELVTQVVEKCGAPFLSYEKQIAALEEKMQERATFNDSRIRVEVELSQYLTASRKPEFISLEAKHFVVTREEVAE